MSDEYHREMTRREMLSMMALTTAVGGAFATAVDAETKLGAIGSNVKTPTTSEGPTAFDDELHEAWRQFCGKVLKAGELAFKQNVQSAQERGEAFRYLSRSIGYAVDRILEQDPEFPHLLRSFHPLRKQAGDNSGGLYHRAVIDGAKTYRIVGTRGTAKWISISVSAPAANPLLPNQYGYKPVGKPLIGPDLVTEWDGSFCVVLSPDPHPGNWVRTTPEVRSVLVREFFEDWAAERPMRVRIERVDTDGKPPPLMHPSSFVEKLQEVGDFVLSATEFWPFGPPQAQELGATVNKVHFHVAASNATGRSHDINAGGISGLCHWMLTDEEALILEFPKFEALYWSFDLLNFWYTSMDYRFRHSSLNSGQAHLDRDGFYRIVVCARDPGFVNWLDTSGWHEGFLEIRANQCPAAPPIAARVVPLASLQDRMPADAKKITHAERKLLVNARAAGVHSRFLDY